MRWQMIILALWPLGAAAQNPCQPLQGTAAHATCLNEELGRAGRDVRSADPDLRALEDQGRGGPEPALTAPDLNLNARTGPPVPAYRSDFNRSQAAQRRRLEQSTQSRAQSLSGRVNRSLSPGVGRAPLY